jgi:phosphoglycerate dehydrogenase-like enzyme
MVEWVILGMLAAVKQLPLFVHRTDARMWKPAPMLDELEGKVALLLGLGSVSHQVAARASAFGMKVWAAVRSERPLPPSVSRLLVGTAWQDVLHEVDFLVFCLPLTDETKHIVNENVLIAIKPTAWLINVARGGLC